MSKLWSRYSYAVYGALLGVVGFPALLSAGYFLAFRGSVPYERPMQILIWITYVVTGALYVLALQYRRPVGFIALVVHILGWAWLPVMLIFVWPV
jgi:hypothetical protein